MRLYGFLVFFLIGISSLVQAQDALIIKEGDVRRGLIKGTDFLQVAFEEDEKAAKLYTAKDIQGFVWNGETYWSKPMLVNEKLVTRFYKVLEEGKINLYTTGMILAPAPTPVKQKVKPSIGIGIGTGGFGTGISVGRGRVNNLPIDETPKPTESKIRYYLEKPGTGPILELNFDYPASVKAQLGLKIQDHKDLFEALKALSSPQPEQVMQIIQAYNAQ